LWNSTSGFPERFHAQRAPAIAVSGQGHRRCVDPDLVGANSDWEYCLCEIVDDRLSAFGPRSRGTRLQRQAGRLYLSSEIVAGSHLAHGLVDHASRQPGEDVAGWYHVFLIVVRKVDATVGAVEDQDLRPTLRNAAAAAFV
jgi:hypothetical protein